ncbi:LamG-like jellyroll fold domain-containing protein [Streptomyces sp. NPDC090445]|uniref:LamG-like jellyroll fold domain-containing protein n=1 Tax=Streptomyces sp. NPDC090445 TaxID=3365963 RepID=UPI0038133968
MTDGKNPPSTPQPEPAPGNGYGFPPVPPAPGGYGYPGTAPAPGSPQAPVGAFGPPPTVPGPPAAPGQPGGGYGFPQQAGAPGGPGAPGQPAAPGQPGGHGFPGQAGAPGAPGAPAVPGTPAAPGGPGAPGAPGAPAGPGAGPYQPGGGPAPFQQNAAVPPAQWPPAGLPVQDAPGPGPFPPLQSEQPDWEAMADRSAAERRKKRLWMIGGGVTVLALLAGGGTFLLMGGNDKGSDDAGGDPSPSTSASASPSPSGSKSKAPVDNTPTVKDDPTKIRDRAGKAPLKMGADAGVFPIDKRFELRTKGNENSYAEAESQIVDTSKSFTVSARVWSRSAKGRQMAVSQGAEKSFAFELGLDQVNGKPAWVFRVQTGDQGAESTVVTVSGESAKMEKTFAQLTATYDAERKQIALYVNGKKAGESAVTGVFQAPGPLQVARARHEDKWTAAWSGAMDSIQTYDALLSPAQIDTLKAGRVDAKTKPSGAWLLF